MAFRSPHRRLLLLTAGLAMAGCASSGSSSAPEELPPVAPCDPQPWDASGAPYADEEYRKAATLPPTITNAAQIQRTVVGATRDLQRSIGGIGGIRLQTVFQLLVGPDGEVLDHQMAVSSGNARMDQLASEIALALEFRPAVRIDCGVVAWFEFPFRIALN